MGNKLTLEIESLYEEVLKNEDYLRWSGEISELLSEFSQTLDSELYKKIVLLADFYELQNIACLKLAARKRENTFNDMLPQK